VVQAAACTMFWRSSHGTHDRRRQTDRRVHRHGIRGLERLPIRPSGSCGARPEAAAELDYTINQIARSLQSRSTQIVGMLVPDISDPSHANVVRVVEGALKVAGYTLVLGTLRILPVESRQGVQVQHSGLWCSEGQYFSHRLVLSGGLEDTARAGT
jgi:hypothetical protein